MLSDIMKEEIPNTNSSINPVLRWRKATPASEDTLAAFWKDLRYFYRTGKKKSDTNNKKYRSALLHLLNQKNKMYPFSLDKRVIELDQDTPFFFLDGVINKHNLTERLSFKEQLTVILTRLKITLGKINKSTLNQELNDNYDFACDLISFDKLSNIIHQPEKVDLTDEKAKRLEEISSALETGLRFITNYKALIFCKEIQQESFSRNKIFLNSELEITEANGAKQIGKIVQKRMRIFTQLIRAYRIALLEIDRSYQDEVHDDYFNHFSWHHLTKSEIKLFPPVILFTDKDQLFGELGEFSKMFSQNIPLKIFVADNQMISAPSPEISWEDASHHYRQELASMAIAQRNVCYFQGTLHDPSAVYSGIEEFVGSNLPGLCHLLTPDNTTNPFDKEAILNAANAGRYFSTISYHPEREYSKKLELSSNIALNSAWSKHSIIAQTSENSETTIDVDLTYADYKAFHPQKALELLIIPPEYYTPQLIPLSDYLDLPEEKLPGLVPFIWLMDEEYELIRAAVPHVWVVSCSERLDYWNFLKDLAGISDTSDEKRDEREVLTGNKEINEPSQLGKDQLNESVLGEAVKRVLEVLLSENLDLENLIRKPVANQPNVKMTVEDKTEMPFAEVDSPKENNNEDPNATEKEPWVESENCTSCNDCTDKFPHIFKYNEEKQATIYDLSKAKYEELVKAAENCPSACIHPGMPQNLNEPNIETLIKRAKKFF